MADVGAIYGTLRAENILIKLNSQQTAIDDIRFLGQGSLIEIDDSQMINIPVQIEHLPPDMTSYLLQIQRFNQNDSKIAKSNDKTQQKLDVKFL